MNNFSKVYTAKELMENGLVTIASLPMEESVMVPLSQAVDLMKQGNNVLYFTFDHDSIKVNEFLKMILSNEVEPEKITGNIAIVDASQIPIGEDWIKFIEDTITQVKIECELKFVFFDIINFVKNNKARQGDDELVASTATLLSFTKKITSIIVKAIDAPAIAITSSQDAKKHLDEFMDKDLMDSLEKSKVLVEQSDYIIGIQRKKESFWKKVINFLLFWRKKNNFTVKVLKNRRGGSKSSHRMNIDFETSKIEVL